MPKAKNDIQNMNINDPQQNISVRITFYFNILKQSILDFFLRIILKWAMSGLSTKRSMEDTKTVKKSFWPKCD